MFDKRIAEECIKRYCPEEQESAFEKRVSISGVLRAGIYNFLKKVDDGVDHDVIFLSDLLYKELNHIVDVQNDLRDDKFAKLKHFSSLPDIVMIVAVASCMSPVALTSNSGHFIRGEYFDRILGFYVTYGKDEGLYRADKGYLWDLFRGFKPKISWSDAYSLSQSVWAIVYSVYGCKSLTDKSDYVAYQNGIYDVINKCFVPFSPDYVFLEKKEEALTIS